jgi:hypothetical protein
MVSDSNDSKVLHMNLDSLNSLTKYPSIPTYHPMGERGRLQETTEQRFESGEPLVVTEKIDGTNCRLIFMADGDYFIGSREHILYAKGDRVGDPAQGIVAAVKKTADRLCTTSWARGLVLFGEVYGGRVTGASKQYTNTGATDFRLFDIMGIAPDEKMLEAEPRQIAAWRDAGHQQFYSADNIMYVAAGCDLHTVPMICGTSPLPAAIAESIDWLEKTIPTSAAVIDGGEGKPEGVVVRTPDRRRIYKLRFEDYRRAMTR